MPRATITDLKLKDGAKYKADLSSANTYYPFGMLLPERNWSSEWYRYGFQGQEKDDEIKGSGNSLDFGARIYDSWFGRWLSLDPLYNLFLPISSFSAFNNNPIVYVDLEGERFRISGQLESGLKDVKSIVSFQNQMAISLEKDMVAIDFNKVSFIYPDAGMELLINLVVSENDYEFNNSNTNNGRPLKSANHTIENNSTTYFSEPFKLMGKKDVLPEGIEGQVYVSLDAMFYAMSGKKENRASIIFHELQENFERTENKYFYEYHIPNDMSKVDDSKPGAHKISIEKAKRLSKNAKSVDGDKSEGRVSKAEKKSQKKEKPKN